MNPDLPGSNPTPPIDVPPEWNPKLKELNDAWNEVYKNYVTQADNFYEFQHRMQQLLLRMVEIVDDVRRHVAQFDAYWKYLNKNFTIEPKASMDDLPEVLYPDTIDWSAPVYDTQRRISIQEDKKS